jgi:serine/threonine protein kinase
MNAVEYAHQQGVYHRDLKPANVLSVDGSWRVADFGLCRDITSDSTTFTQSNTVLGTIAYMAPEQFDDGHDIDATADVFALARMLYHMLSGKSPFPYAPLDKLPPAFRYLVSKAMSEEPANRYATVAEFSRQLELIVGDSSVLTSPAERGKGLLTQALASNERARDDLLALIAGNADDEVFYTEFVSRLPRPILAAFQATNPSVFADVVKTFDRYSEGGHPFNYVDVIADFCATVFSVASDPMLRQRMLRRIMIVGEAHNRFYVGEVFARLVASLTDPHDILLAVNVMRDDPATARWYGQELRQRSLPREIKDLLNEAG